MSVAEQLLELCNEFYAAVTPWEQKRNAGLNLLYGKVKKNIEKGLDGFSDDQEFKLVKETIGDLREMMDQITEDEKKRNPKLEKRFDEIQELLADLRAEMSGGDGGYDFLGDPESPCFDPEEEEDVEDEDDFDDDDDDEDDPTDDEDEDEDEEEEEDYDNDYDAMDDDFDEEDPWA